MGVDRLAQIALHNHRAKGPLVCRNDVLLVCDATHRSERSLNRL